MTKTKVKGSFARSPLSRYPLDQHAPDRSYMPFVKIENKRKRAPRGMARHTQEGLLDDDQEEDSASEFETSSSSRDEQDADDANVSAMNSSSRQGSTHLKMKYLKLRESALEKPFNSLDTLYGRDVGSFITPAEKYYKKRSTMKFDESRRQVLTREHFGFMNPLKEHTIMSMSEGSSNELQEALKVIKKIMKMDAAEPFNAPVDPVTLGIHDYFDIIKHPMDLGTICKNLERSGKYRKSRDVYEDVQLIWANCRKYNRKGDPILELLARVKKNFMKYWSAAGLYTEKSPALLELSMDENKAGQHFDENKARQHFDEGLCGREDDPNISSDDEEEHDDTSFNQQGSIRYPDMNNTKKKYEDQKDGQYRLHPGQISHTLEGRDTIVDGWERPADKQQGQRKKIGDLHVTPAKSKRVSGTGHHKPDCTCVVCTGIRRKLAREGKLGNMMQENTAAGGAQEKLFVKLKTEGQGKNTGKLISRSGLKIRIGETSKVGIVGEDATGHRDKSSDVQDETTEMVKDNRLTPEMNIGTPDETTAEALSESHGEEGVEEGHKNEAQTSKGNGIRSEQTLEAGRKESLMGERDDQEADSDQDGGAQQYQAYYEMPLRKIKPEILQMGQRLFGADSVWNKGLSGGRRSDSYFGNPIFSTVSSLIGK